MPISVLLNRPQLVTLREVPDPRTADLFAGPPLAFLVFDGSINESYRSPVRVTQHPVEEGADITDHVQVLPRSITINGIISDSPLPLQTLSFEAFTSGLGSSALAETLGSATRSQLAYEELERIKNSRRPFEVVTGLDVFSPVVMSNLVVNRNARTGRALNFSMTVREIVIVSTELVSEDLGRQTADPLGTPVELGAVP